MTQIFNNLSEAIKTGLLDRRIISDERLQPRLLLNDRDLGEKVLSSILDSLGKCDEFWFSVAFATSSGIASIHNKLLELERKGVKGRVLVSQYLNFTHPEALRALRRFSNIETRFIQDVDFHGKGYIFKDGDQYELVIGSSNLTSEALCENNELNMKITASEGSKLIQDSLASFGKVFQSAVPLTSEVIDRYEEKFYDSKLRHPEVYSSKRQLIRTDKQAVFEPNSMQIEALQRLDYLRKSGLDKSLVISATGTGKTVLAALDARSMEAKTLLFVVHRGTIARKAMDTFEAVFGDAKTFGLYSGGRHEMGADFVFCTVQTINNQEHLHRFARDAFDYIIIDETHRAGAMTYRKVLDYFEPKFLLGMTATPERMDGFDIFALFDHHIGYEIRLQRAMEEGLLSQFHYFGVTDITVDGRELDEESDFRLLVADERINRIIDVAQKYGCDNGILRGLIFCSKVDEAEELSRLFNLRGFATVALSGKDSEEDRLNAIDRLENDNLSNKLDYIITVDIFNEGVDIPKVNQIIMLRPTQSPIIFVQQLGRGLRNVKGKEYLTVIDFIGNYHNNYMIPIALFGDSSYNKDTLRKLMTSGSSLIPGSSTINFDEIAQQKIFDSINATNLNRKRDLVQDYLLLKTRNGKVPMMMDFIESNSRDPFSFVEYSKSYLDFVNMVEEGIYFELPPFAARLLQYLCKNINDGKRLEESALISSLIMEGSISVNKFYRQLKQKFNFDAKEDNLNSIVRNVNLRFITERSGAKTIPVGELYDYEIVTLDTELIKIGKSLSESLEYPAFRECLDDSVKYSLATFARSFSPEGYIAGFQRYRKYSRKDVFRILNWPANPNPQNVGGYIVSNDLSNCPIFVNYQKMEGIADTIKYEDRFVAPDRFTYMSKNRRTLSSPDVMTIKNQKTNGIRLPLFIKKSNDEGLDFYFMGDLTVIENSFSEEIMATGNSSDVSVVKMDFHLDKSVEPRIYSYITDDK
jgi:superfamily II DNA or RNA helicase